MRKKILPILSLALLLALAGCSSTQAPERQVRPSPPHTIHVTPFGHAVATSDGFSARIEIEVVSFLNLERNALVQELEQEVVLERANGATSRRSFTLVEAFRLERTYVDFAGRNHYRLQLGQRDHHSITGLDDLPADVVGVTINRRVFAYVANVYGADFTDSGFAHLPRNQDGDVVSEPPRNFNQRYQDSHETRGWVQDAGDSLGLTYRMRYHFVRTPSGSPGFVLDRAGGLGYVESPTVIVR
ncbi:MAG: hypothetical protein KF696_05790 [Planctomycetes bacterium]|nr:hypothetical protein [Planctomycetota bacterium]MCW8136398.1 hypothetical protein [Planctomycetota bacterium]